MEHKMPAKPEKPQQPKKPVNKKLLFAAIVLVIIFTSIILNLLTSYLRYQLVQVKPNPETQALGVIENIEVTFNKEVTEEFFNSCKFTVAPESAHQLSFTGNTIIARPDNLRVPETKYSLEVRCRDFATDLIFTTKSQDQLDELETEVKQTERDYDFAKGIEALYEAEPWRKSLPIIKPYFTVMPDDVKDRYFVRLTIPADKKITRQEITKQVQEELKKIGAPEKELFLY
jgi:hypothetical protein